MAVLINGLVALKHLGSASTPRILVVSLALSGVALVIIFKGSFALFTYKYCSSTFITGESFQPISTNRSNSEKKTIVATRFPKIALIDTAKIRQKPATAIQAQNGGVNFSRNSNWFMRQPCQRSNLRYMSAPLGLEILVTKLDKDAVIPTYAKKGDAGADLYSISDLVLAPGERALVRTGIAIALPDGYVGLVHPRSGLGLKNGISVVNTPGTIDSGYRGEIGVVLINHDLTNNFQVKKGDRIAQLLIQKVETANFKIVNELPDSERSAGGYGSTGV